MEFSTTFFNQGECLCPTTIFNLLERSLFFLCVMHCPLFTFPGQSHLATTTIIHTKQHFVQTIISCGPVVMPLSTLGCPII